jgi:hypothetical protein
MKTPNLLTGALLLGNLLVSPPLFAADAAPRAPTRSAAIQVGGGVVEYLICVRETHASGASWDTAASEGLGGARTGESRHSATGSAAPGHASGSR